MQQSKSERILQLLRDIQLLDEQNEALKLTERRWYETYWDYQYRVRNIPNNHFLFAPSYYWSEGDLLGFIEITRKADIKELACKAMLNNIYKETIAAGDIKFDILRGKNCKTGWRKICINNEQLKTLFYGSADWCYSTQFKTINAN